MMASALKNESQMSARAQELLILMPGAHLGQYGIPNA